MLEKSTLARPYASAVFKLASQEDKFDLWSEMLGFLASLARDPQLEAIIDDPRIDNAQLVELINSIAGGRFNEHMQNLVRILADNDRLGVAGEIARQYEEQKATAQKRERVEVVSAYEVNPKFKQSISAAMAKRLGCEVELETRIDRDLIGGVIIRAGDMVIDASLKGRLAKLSSMLA